MPPKKEKVEWVVPPIPPPIEGPPRKYEFFDYEEGDDCAAILEKNFLLRAMIGQVRLTAPPSANQTEDEAAINNLAKECGQRLANIADMDHLLKSVLVERCREVGSRNWIDTGASTSSSDTPSTSSAGPTTAPEEDEKDADKVQPCTTSKKKRVVKKARRRL